MQKREPAATLAWVFSLLFLPYLGFFIFYFFGPRKLRRSESKRRGSYEAVRQAYAAGDARPAPSRRTTWRCSSRAWCRPPPACR
jgi:cardiolipin synthase